MGAERYRIGDLELDVDSATLRRDGDRLRLPPRTLELFLELVRAHPGLLRRRELLERVWPDEHVTDQTLSQRVLLLRRALGDDAQQPVYVSGERGYGYRLLGPVERLPSDGAPARAALDPAAGRPREDRQSDDSAPSPGAATGRSRRRWIALALVAGVALASAAPEWLRRHGEPGTPALGQLTSVPRIHTGSFSPDGTQVVLAAQGEHGNVFHLWLTVPGGAEARPLTTGPFQEAFPAWSPDGKLVAFLRVGMAGESGTVHLVSSLGGQERQLSDLPAWRQLTWSPDGRWLAAARTRTPGETMPEAGGIHLIDTASGAAHALTFPKVPAYDLDPAFSPDGEALAYAACGAGVGGACDVVVVRLGPDARAEGPARRVTAERFLGCGLTWTHDGRSVVYGAARNLVLPGLFRVGVDGGSPPTRLELAGREACWPFAAATGGRLGFRRGLVDYDIRRFRVGESTLPVLASTGWDFQPQHSPDGRRVAFASDREGETIEVWTADADGSGPKRLTRGPGRAQGSPRWSPDGRSIVFDSQTEDGSFDIWTIGADGSGLRRVTHGPADENVPSWSRDGRWIYFGSNCTGRYEIWRVPAAGGAEEQVTSEGGDVPYESFDGRVLYYKRKNADSPLMSKPLAGGKERMISRCVPFPFGFAVGPEGIFHLDCTTPTAAGSAGHSLWQWDARTGRDRVIGSLEDSAPLGLSVSPDGKTILYTKGMSRSDLMVIENFR